MSRILGPDGKLTTPSPTIMAMGMLRGILKRQIDLQTKIDGDRRARELRESCGVADRPSVIGSTLSIRLPNRYLTKKENQ